MPEIDLYLWARVQSGDKEAFEILFHKYYSTLYLLSKRYTKDFTAAREIVQRLFIHLWEHRMQINITLSLNAYLLQAIRFNSIRYLENDRKIGIRSDVIPESNYEKEFHPQSLRGSRCCKRVCQCSHA